MVQTVSIATSLIVSHAPFATFFVAASIKPSSIYFSFLKISQDSIAITRPFYFLFFEVDLRFFVVRISVFVMRPSAYTVKRYCFISFRLFGKLADISAVSKTLTVPLRFCGIFLAIRCAPSESRNVPCANARARRVAERRRRILRRFPAVEVLRRAYLRAFRRRLRLVRRCILRYPFAMPFFLRL